MMQLTLYATLQIMNPASSSFAGSQDVHSDQDGGSTILQGFAAEPIPINAMHAEDAMTGVLLGADDSISQAGHSL
jgi:hypothetical protein